jgi:hypothetical protein
MSEKERAALGYLSGEALEKAKQEARWIDPAIGVGRDCPAEFVAASVVQGLVEYARHRPTCLLSVWAKGPGGQWGGAPPANYECDCGLDAALSRYEATRKTMGGTDGGPGLKAPPKCPSTADLFETP